MLDQTNSASTSAAQVESISVKEATEIGAHDGIFWGHYFFPKTFRQKSPYFHYQLMEALDAPYRMLNGEMIPNRFVNARIFRDGAKTSLLRMYVARRVAYAISRTILFVGISETSAARSLQWLMKAVEFNSRYRDTYKLSKGKIWQPSGAQLEIRHGLENCSIHALALGVTGSSRGINLEDHRPDLIVIDDVVDENNSITPESREKIVELVHASLRNSLAPSSEFPEAKLVFLQTPIAEDDASDICSKDELFWSFHVPVVDQCDDMDSAVAAWPERFPTTDVRREMEAFAKLNRLHLWMREKMCTITSAATSSFLPEWLRFWTVLPDDMTYFIGIDPIPPRTKDDVMKARLQKGDWLAAVVIGKRRGETYLVDYLLSREEDPDTLVNWLNIQTRLRPIRNVAVETVAFQKSLQWFFERQMRKGVLKHVRLSPYNDKRKKHVRILDGIQGLASSGCLYISKEHTAFIAQYTKYPNVTNDDLLDAFCIADSATIGGVEYHEIEAEEQENYPPLELNGCP